MRNVPGWLALLLAAAAAAAGCTPSPQAGASNAPGGPAATEPATPYADVLTTASETVRLAQARAAAPGSPWTAHEALALAYLDRAQLTGSYDNYAAADRAVAQARALGGDGACLAVARVHLTLHRLAQAEAAVAGCERRPQASAAEQAELAGIAGEAAFLRGDYERALRRYRESLRLGESLAGLARLSRYYAALGAPTEAAALLDRAERLYHGPSAQPLAWLALQRGQLALAQGRWDEALAHDLRASRLMPGWWLAEEHVAEIHALRGELGVARQEYEALVERTQAPELMDALARVLLEQRDSGAAQWIARARDLYRARLAQLPEAAVGHALEHFLRFEPLDGAQLLSLAQRNAAARPGAEPRILLAQALLRLGQARQAADTLAPVLASAWSTAQLHATAAAVFAALRDEAAAERARRQAVAINPHALQMYPVTTGSRAS